MNLYDVLENYKTTPQNEIRKIKEILKREHYVSYSGCSFQNYLELQFLQSDFIKYESDLHNFLDNFVFVYEPGLDYAPIDIAIREYRLFCELLLDLLSERNENISLYNAFKKDINQLKLLIEEGLRISGYKIIDYKGKLVTSKNDDVAESIALSSDKYRNTIFDYLIAKDVKEKEKIITEFSIKLESEKTKEDFVNTCREFVQLPRHKEEKIKDPKYSWFYLDDYEENLDKLFKLYVASLAHLNSKEIIADFKNRGNK